MAKNADTGERGLSDANETTRPTTKRTLKCIALASVGVAFGALCAVSVGEGNFIAMSDTKSAELDWTKPAFDSDSGKFDWTKSNSRSFAEPKKMRSVAEQKIIKQANTGTRLILFRGTNSKNMEVKTMSAKKGHLDTNDVFIIDNGSNKIAVWVGQKAGFQEKFKALKMANEIKSNRRGSFKVEVLEEAKTSVDHPMLMLLKGGDPPLKKPSEYKGEMSISKLSDATGKMELTTVMSGVLDKTKLTSDGVFLVNTGTHLFVWIGKEASTLERKYSQSEAANYLARSKTPFNPITTVNEGQEPQNFAKIW